MTPTSIREAARRGEPDPQAFLRSLGLRVRIERCRPEQRARVAQLLERTTQFNLTGKRFSEAQLAEIEADHGLVLVASAVDKFGDYGLVAVLIGEPSREIWWMKNFVMSCRVLGRGIESTILRSLLARQPLPVLAVCYATLRNKPARDVFRRHGFESATSSDLNDGDYWYSPADPNRIPPCDYIEVDDVP